EDKHHPYNYSNARKWWILTIVCSAALAVTATSSIGGSASKQLQRQFNVSQLTTVAGTSLFALGLATGGLVFAPLSEFLGRRYIFLISFTLFTIFNVPVAFAQNIAPYLAFRLLTGFVGTAFLSVAGGVVSDMWRPGTTDWPVAVYTLSPLLGPAVGPIVGGFIGQNASWRIIFYVITGWSAVELVLIFLFVPETQLSILQKKKAQALRSKDPKYIAPIEKAKRTVPQAFKASFVNFVQILLFEKMAFLLNIWAALILGIIYLFFGGIPFVFRTRYNFNLQSTGLAFIPLGAGQLAALFTTGFFARKIRESAAKNSGAPIPESRLLVGIAGAVITPLGLFWLAFTSYPKVRFIVPFFGLFLFGAGSSFVFFCIFGFLIAVYRQNAAAALAGNTFVRCLLAGGFPLIGPTFYGRLGAVRATATLAGITTAFVPIPFILYKYGPKFRASSKYT
ncbi:MFS general substrate transporter, partial [Atractiella rhizophila]